MVVQLPKVYRSEHYPLHGILYARSFIGNLVESPINLLQFWIFWRLDFLIVQWRVTQYTIDIAQSNGNLYSIFIVLHDSGNFEVVATE